MVSKPSPRNESTTIKNIDLKDLRRWIPTQVQKQINDNDKKLHHGEPWRNSTTRTIECGN